MPLIANVLKPLAKIVLIPLGLTAAAHATNATIHNKIIGSSFKTLIISDEVMNDIMKIVKSLGGFLGILLGILGASLLRNLLTDKSTVRAGEGTIRAGENF